jgi:hypothetical protein
MPIPACLFVLEASHFRVRRSNRRQCERVDRNVPIYRSCIKLSIRIRESCVRITSYSVVPSSPYERVGWYALGQEIETSKTTFLRTACVIEQSDRLRRAPLRRARAVARSMFTQPEPAASAWTSRPHRQAQVHAAPRLCRAPPRFRCCSRDRKFLELSAMPSVVEVLGKVAFGSVMPRPVWLPTSSHG